MKVLISFAYKKKFNNIVLIKKYFISLYFKFKDILI